MAGEKKPGDAARDAVREVGAVVGGAGRRLARGLRDLTRRPEDESDEETPESDDAELGRKLRELGHNFVDVMGSVSAKTGRSIRRAAYDVADGVRGAIDGARAARASDSAPPAPGDDAGDTAPAGDLEDVDDDSQ